MAACPPLRSKQSKKISIFVQTTIIFIPLLCSLFDQFTLNENKCDTQKNLNPFQTQDDAIVNSPRATSFEKDKDETTNKKPITTKGNHDEKNKKGQIKTIDCNVYLAESSIPHAGLGMFVAKDLPEKGVLTDSDLPIIVTDIEAHNDEGFQWLLDNYYWSSTMVDAHHEAYSVSVAMPSFGMLGNNHAGLQNANMEWNMRERNPRFHRKNDPGAGAVSDYRTMSWFATRPISAGEEVFLWYGEGYFTERESVYGMIPFRDNYLKADNITKEFTSIIGKNDLNNEKKQGLWRLMKAMTGPRTRSALPNDVASAYDAAKIGTARYSLPNSVRSIEWLEKNGQCMDNLKVRHSKLPQAGRGAFASRFIDKGSLVAPVPLVQILDRDRLNMYVLSDNNARINDHVIGKQLILNYCFGHPDSSLLLFPYSSAVQFINHSSKKYNAEIRWSKSKFHHSDWLKTPIGNMTLDHSGLMFDIVATKDIRPGDEVLINYGKDWEQAWKRHVKNWKPDESAKDFVHPETMNNDSHSTIRTLKEQYDEPYPSNVETACYYWRDLSKFDIEYEGDQAKVNVKWYFDDEDYEKVYLRPCTIIERYERNSSGHAKYYKAQMFNHNEHMENDFIPTNEEHIVFDIPRHAIEFIGKTYSSDIFLRNAFRHYIGVPDHLFPSIWLNRVDEN